MSKVNLCDKAWRLTCPSAMPYGGHFQASSGLCVAYITGPEVWKMRYHAQEFDTAELLGENPFINFSGP